MTTHNATEILQRLCDDLNALGFREPFDADNVNESRVVRVISAHYPRIVRALVTEVTPTPADPNESHATTTARAILDDGAAGDYFRGELGAVACDDRELWVDVARELTRLIEDGIQCVKEVATREAADEISHW